MQYPTNQNERELIQFLGSKIDALTESMSSKSENSIDTSDRPAPDSINLEFFRSPDCQSRSSTDINRRSQQVTIVGGGGRMGSFFNSRLSQAGHQVKILGSQDWKQAEELLAGADLVLVSVPIAYTVETIERVTKYLSPTTALADITSIKTPIVKAMLERHNGPVIGLHPMFGPKIESFSAQKVVVCSGRHDGAFQWFLELIKSDGGELIFATPEEHDRMMATVQAIRNFATLSFGAFLFQDNVELERSLDFSSPAYRQQIKLVQRLFVQSPTLVIDILLATPESRAAIARLGNLCCRLAQLVEQGERDALIAEFEAVNSFFHQNLPSTNN